MQYCSRNCLINGRLPEPATDQTLFTSAPRVQCPGCVNATADGPIPSLPCPRNVFVAVGNWKTGPAPQITFPDFFGVRKNVGTMSPKPYTPVSGVGRWLGSGCQMIGVITLMIRFQSFEMPIG